MFNYPSAAATATRLLKQFGTPQPLTYKRRGNNAVFDPVTGKFTSAGDWQTATADTVVLSVKQSAVEMDNDLLEALAQGKLRSLLVAPTLTFGELLNNDTVTLNNQDWTVVRSTPLDPSASQPVLHKAIIQLK